MDDIAKLKAKISSTKYELENIKQEVRHCGYRLGGLSSITEEGGD